MMEQDYNIASAIVLVRPERLAAVSANLLSQEGVEIHATEDHGRLVVTVEGDQHRGVANVLTAFNEIDGVLAVDLIYQHSESINDPTHDKLRRSHGETD